MRDDITFKSLDALKPVENVLKEAEAALNDKNRNISTSSIPEILGGIAGGGSGACIGFTALYFMGVQGLSAAGITSGLAAAGALVGGGMLAGMAVLAAPAVILGIGGYAILSNRKHKKLRQTKEAFLERAIQLRDGIVQNLKAKVYENEERLDYLKSLNALLQEAIKDLRKDLGKTEE